MLIKIENDYIDPNEIAAAEYVPATHNGQEHYFVTLRSGEDVILYCSQAEFEKGLDEGLGRQRPVFRPQWYPVHRINPEDLDQPNK